MDQIRKTELLLGSTKIEIKTEKILKTILKANERLSQV